VLSRKAPRSSPRPAAIRGCPPGPLIGRYLGHSLSPRKSSPPGKLSFPRQGVRGWGGGLWEVARYRPQLSRVFFPCKCLFGKPSGDGWGVVRGSCTAETVTSRRCQGFVSDRSRQVATFRGAEGYAGLTPATIFITLPFSHQRSSCSVAPDSPPPDEAPWPHPFGTGSALRSTRPDPPPPAAPVPRWLPTRACPTTGVRGSYPESNKLLK